jgi:predicted DNA-binding protein (UPF0251 family)
LPRRRRTRCCQKFFGGDTVYKPRAIPLERLCVIDLGLDELEAMRLCDVEDLQQVEAASLLGVSRGTLQRLLWSGRRKLVGAVVEGQAVRIVSGSHIEEREADGCLRGPDTETEEGA